MTTFVADGYIEFGFATNPKPSKSILDARQSITERFLSLIADHLELLDADIDFSPVDKSDYSYSTVLVPFNIRGSQNPEFADLLTHLFGDATTVKDIFLQLYSVSVDIHYNEMDLRAFAVRHSSFHADIKNGEVLDAMSEHDPSDTLTPRTYAKYGFGSPHIARECWLIKD